MEEKKIIIKTSKTNLPIPVINGVHLHSIYNPEKEAESQIANHQQLLKSKNKILILGLGFGYHVREIKKQLQVHHRNNYKITIIEPSREIYNNYNELFSHSDENINIICQQDIRKLYQETDVNLFLASRPGIIPHNVSFQIHNDYFKQFLSYKASQKVNDFISKIEHFELKDYMAQFEGCENFNSIVDKIKSRTQFIEDPKDFLMLAYNEITNFSSLDEVTK